MVTLNLDPSDCKNAADMIEMYFFQNLKDLLDAKELDNIEYVRSMIKTIDELKRVGSNADC